MRRRIVWILWSILAAAAPPMAGEVPPYSVPEAPGPEDSLGEPLAFESLTVERGDLLHGRLDGAEVALAIAGVWTPRPDRGDGGPHYRGEEARRLTARLLSTHAFELQLGELPAGGRRLPVRVLVGPARAAVRESPRRAAPGASRDRRRDLAVLLAAAGLAVADPASALDERQAEAIRAAERTARRARRGVHDGGWQRFSRAAGRVKSLGVEIWSVFELGDGGAAPRASPGTDREAEPGAWWSRPSDVEPLPLIVPGSRLSVRGRRASGEGRHSQSEDSSSRPPG